jgi:hypothetical protein
MNTKGYDAHLNIGLSGFLSQRYSSLNGTRAERVAEELPEIYRAILKRSLL